MKHQAYRPRSATGVTALALATIVVLGACARGGLLGGATRKILGKGDDGAGQSVPEDSGKPTDESEGLPGYLVDPELVVTKPADDPGTLVTAGAVAAVAAAGGDPAGIVVRIWRASAAVLEGARGGVTQAIAATALARTSVAKDGSFTVTYSTAPGSTGAPGDALVLTLGGGETDGVLPPDALVGVGAHPSAALLEGDAAGRARALFAADLAAHGVAVATLPPATRPAAWLTRAELLTRPTSGVAWEYVREVADRPLVGPTVGDHDSRDNVLTLARALVFARTGEARYRDEVVDACLTVIGTEAAGGQFDVGHKLVAYVAAADLVGLPPDAAAAFDAWLRRLAVEPLAGETLTGVHERRPLNWGTHAGAARAAIAAHVGDAAELARSATVLRGWLGDRAAYDGFEFGADLSWQADPAAPVGVNPSGAVKDGHPIDGAIPDSMREGGPFAWPPTPTVQPFDTLAGAALHAEILRRNGHDLWDAQDSALRRALRFLVEDAAFEVGDDKRWLLWLLDARYGTTYGGGVVGRFGSSGGFAEWTAGG